MNVKKRKYDFSLSICVFVYCVISCMNFLRKEHVRGHDFVIEEPNGKMNEKKEKKEKKKWEWKREKEIVEHKRGR